MPPSLEIDDELIEELGGVSRSRVTLHLIRRLQNSSASTPKKEKK
jgi:hypothetical protein